jgi:uncharacterized protein YndB with AHSA1/START domain
MSVGQTMPVKFETKRNWHLAVGAAIAALLVKCADANAAVTSIAPNGFEVRETLHIGAPADKVYAAIAEPAQWWDSAHTFSGNAANMTFDAKAGGCWCETLPDGGFVQHLVVVYASPGKVLRLRGALGPFQAMPVDGVLTWSLKGEGDGTGLTVTYAVGGYAKDGFDAISKGVDGVLAEQAERLKTFVETGSPGKAIHQSEVRP